ncbi:hypothetical protein [Streptacidiphilus sp. EB129]
MSIHGDERDAQIDAWVEEQIALSPTWSAEKWESILALLEPSDKE